MRAVYHQWRMHCSAACSVRSSKADAFTLLELLIVTVVLTVLVLTLLPALARTKSPAARTKCADNLRLLMQGAGMFALDNHDLMPYPNWGTYGPGWLYLPVSGGLPPSSTDPSTSNGGLWPFVKTKDAYTCPLDSNSRYYSMRYNKLSTYVMNGAVCGYGMLAGSAYSLNQFKPEAYACWEPKDGPFAYNDASSYPSQDEAPGRNHPSGTPVGTFGGAAVFPPIQYFQNLQTGTGPNLVWCNPGTTGGR
jgi:hypothetical protein